MSNRGCDFCEFNVDVAEGTDWCERLAAHVRMNHPKQLELWKRESHFCEQCDEDRFIVFGRDAWCHARMVENIQAQLEEDSDDGRMIRAELAKEAREAREKKHGPH